MFFISQKVGEKYGVVDTEDWVEEFYTANELKIFESRGIAIEKSSIQKDMLNFIWYFWSTSGDCGSSTMDLVCEYVKGKVSINSLRNDLGSSTLDIVEDLKKLYDNIKPKWNDLDIDSFGRGHELYDMVSQCCEMNRSRYSRQDYANKADALAFEIHDTFHFKLDLVKSILM